MTKKECILALAEAGLIRFGSFTLKSGRTSPLYIDLRECVARPALFTGVVDLLETLLRPLDFDMLCGIPYAALPFAAVLAERLGKPLVYNRKEEKAYGTGGQVVGASAGRGRCLLLDDLVTTGGSKLETVALFEKAGYTVGDVVVLIDRSPNAASVLAARGINFHALISLEEILETMSAAGAVSAAQREAVRAFTCSLETDPAPLGQPEGGTRAREFPVNAFAARLRSVIAEKRSTIVLSLDATDQNAFFSVLERTAPHIAALKTHADMLDDFDWSFVERVKALAAAHGFLIMEDRKFADIGNTVRRQYRNGIHRIGDWAELVTVHLLPGEAILQGLFEGQAEGGAVLIARMSSSGCLIDAEYTAAVLEAGRRNHAWVCGYVAHAVDIKELLTIRNAIPAGQLLFVPGVHHQKSSDSLGQRYLSVEEAVEGGADLLIVGRAIYESADAETTIVELKERAWSAYSRRNRNA